MRTHSKAHPAIVLALFCQVLAPGAPAQTTPAQTQTASSYQLQPLGLPELPVLMRDTWLIDKSGGAPATARYPAIPPVRTSADGRIGFDVKNLEFYLLSPERLDTWLLESDAGTGILGNHSLTTSHLLLEGSDESGAFRHTTICDRGTNPQPCADEPGKDCYALTIIAPWRWEDDNQVAWVQLWGTDVEVKVDKAKTDEAVIESIDQVGSPVGGPAFEMDTIFETVTTADGRLLVGRVGGKLASLPDIDIVYAVNTTPSRCDVTQWDHFHSITYAPDDPDIDQNGYGIGLYPFRDPEGNLIPSSDGDDLHGTYPWIDRDGDNLFFTSIGATLWYQDAGDANTMKERYPASCVPGEACTTLDQITPAIQQTLDSPGQTRGTSMIGLWTHGKAVLLDTLFNNNDYGMKIPADLQRMLQLYEPGSGPNGNESGKVRAGTGRDNSSQSNFPDGFINNSTFIDSTEQLFNAYEFMFPRSVRDVVWIVNTGHGSDEVIFDDYVDPNVFIFSDMSPSMAWADSVVANDFNLFDGFERHQNGWKGYGFTGNQPIRVQNAATSPAVVWDIPGGGEVTGGARIEPLALGGIRGRGLWLDGSNDSVTYDVPAQSSDVDLVPWYFGLFIDARFQDDRRVRRLITFPDGTSLRARGRSELRIVDAAGALVHAFALQPSEWIPHRAWQHIGLIRDPGGQRVRLYLNGFLFDEWNGSQSVFGMPAGTLHLGKAQGFGGASFRGWIDEFKAIADEPNPEVVCNHARGTLVAAGPMAIGNPTVALQAASYPEGSHSAIEMELSSTSSPGAVASNAAIGSVGEIDPIPAYLCHHDYTSEPGAHLGNIPPGTQSVREQFIFPEGPLHYGQERPASDQNAFCLSCHVSTQLSPTLQPGALAFIDMLLMQHDGRRQPMQPPARIFGHIPALHYGLAPTAPIDSTQGEEQDQWVFP